MSDSVIRQGILAQCFDNHWDAEDIVRLFGVGDLITECAIAFFRPSWNIVLLGYQVIFPEVRLSECRFTLAH